jgi:hypothetical protein
MTVYSYAQLEGLWIQAGGPKQQAPLMAAIAEAESGGNSDAENPSGATGLWQILGNPFPGNAYDPATNAKMAVAKYHSQGLGAWSTYTNGAYKAYLSGKTTPDMNIPGSPTATAAGASAAASADCLVGGTHVGLLFGAGPTLPCLFTKSNARAFLGAWLMTASGLVALAGTAVLGVAVGLKMAAPAGKSAEMVGGALMLVPGAEGAGAAIMAGGKAAQNPARAGRQKAAQGAADDTALRRQVGEPRENPDLEVHGGAVRESGEQRSARQRREQGAGRARARRLAGSTGTPATREETGF